MKRLTSILAISVIAVMSAGAARADIASTTYVDNKVSPVATKADTNASDITALKSGKQDKLGYTAENTANKLASGGNMEEIVKAADADTKYPTVKAALEIAQVAAGAETGKFKALANYDTVSTDLIENGAVTSAKIADGTIATADLSGGSVTTAKIADLNVTEGKIAANAVTTAKIKDANVTTAKVADGAITSAKIANGTIAEADLSDAVKTKLNATVQTFNPASATAGKYVTNFTKSGTTVTATTAYVQIPVGSATAPTSVASIWVE